MGMFDHDEPSRLVLAPAQRRIELEWIELGLRTADGHRIMIGSRI